MFTFSVLVQCSKLHVQISVFNVYCSKFSIQCPKSLINVQCSMFTVHCSMFTVRCLLFIVQCSWLTSGSRMFTFEVNLHSNYHNHHEFVAHSISYMGARRVGWLARVGLCPTPSTPENQEHFSHYVGGLLAIFFHMWELFVFIGFDGHVLHLEK